MTRKPENIWRMWSITIANKNDEAFERAWKQSHGMAKRRNVWLGTPNDVLAPKLLECRGLCAKLFAMDEDFQIQEIP